MKGYMLPIGYKLIYSHELSSWYILYKYFYGGPEDFIFDDNFLEFQNKTKEFCKKLNIDYECGIYYYKKERY